MVVVDRSGAEVARLPEEPGHWVQSASFSPDSRLLATTIVGERVDPTDASVRIWDWERGEVVSTIDTFADGVVFDPTGTRIATFHTVQGTANVWDARTGDHLLTLAPPAAVGEITFSPDGTLMATGLSDGTVRLLDAETGVQQLVLQGDESPVGTLVFSPDGSKLASVGDDGIAHVWALDLDDLIAIATDRLTRSLSDDECRQYLHVERCPQP